MLKPDRLSVAEARELFVYKKESPAHDSWARIRRRARVDPVTFAKIVDLSRLLVLGVPHDEIQSNLERPAVARILDYIRRES